MAELAYRSQAKKRMSSSRSQGSEAVSSVDGENSQPLSPPTVKFMQINQTTQQGASTSEKIQQNPTKKECNNFFKDFEDLAAHLFDSDQSSDHQLEATHSTKKQHKLEDKLTHKLNQQHNNTVQTKTLQSQSIIRPRTTAVKLPKQAYAEEIYLKSLSASGAIKLQKFRCFKDADLCIPKQFADVIEQHSDDDKCSDDDLMEKAVNFMHKKLVASVVEINGKAVIPDANKVFTMKDIKIDRDTEEEDEEEEEQDDNEISEEDSDAEYQGDSDSDSRSFQSRESTCSVREQPKSHEKSKIQENKFRQRSNGFQFRY